MSKRATPEAKLIELFDQVSIPHAETLVGIAKALLTQKRKREGTSPARNPKALRTASKIEVREEK